MHIGKEIFCKTVCRLRLIEREGSCLWSDFMQKYAKIPWLPAPLITSSFKIKMVGRHVFGSCGKEPVIGRWVWHKKKDATGKNAKRD